MKIFYSWQLDAPRKINKDFVYGALTRAIGKLGDDLDITEAERDGIELDQDTQGVLGSPDIVRVILDKIAISNVVVADVSLVAKGKEGKPHINSNVAIELGYTYGKLGDKAVLKVMNTHFGKPDELPFDLRTRRHPVQYHLSPTAHSETIANEQKKLASELTSILKLYLESPSNTKPSIHLETPYTNLRGAFWKPDDVLVPAGDKRYIRNDVFWNGQSTLYFRCIPETELPQLSARETFDLSADMWPLLSQDGFSRTRNKWGTICHCRAHDGDLIGFTQLFKNREIWGVDAYYSEMTSTSEDEEPQRYVPTGAIQREYPKAISGMRQLASMLDYGDRYTIEMGFSRAEGVYLATKAPYYERPGPFYDPEIYIRKSISADYPTGAIMGDFWEKMFSEVGHGVPEKLVWSSPGQPE